MNVRKFRAVVLLPAALLVAALPVLHAEEGMWTFDNPPLKLLKAKYGFTPTQAWLDHLRLSSVRLNDGGSGSFVSADGLLLFVLVQNTIAPDVVMATAVATGETVWQLELQRNLDTHCLAVSPNGATVAISGIFTTSPASPSGDFVSGLRAGLSSAELISTT